MMGKYGWLSSRHGLVETSASVACLILSVGGAIVVCFDADGARRRYSVCRHRRPLCHGIAVAAASMAVICREADMA